MDSVMATIHQCMQRGERPLSVIDVIKKELITLNQAAWLISRIGAGSSWLIGAVPSHAGKTTLMSALLVFLEDGQQVTLARAGLPWESFGQGSFVVSEEISGHGREVYLWGEDVRGFTTIPARSGRIAATIHANTLDQVREQVSRGCGAGESGVASFGIFIPIDVEFAPESLEDAPSLQEGRRRRTVSSRTVEFIHYYEEDNWKGIDREVKLTRQQDSIADFLRSCLESGICNCEALREAWLARRG